MMSFLRAAAAAAAWAVLCGEAGAFPGAGMSKGKAAAHGKAATTRPAGTVKGRYDHAVTELKLPADKAEAVQKILDENYKSLMAWVAKVDPEVVKLRAQMRAVHGSTDPNTVAKAQAALKRYRELQREMAGKVSEVFEPLGKVLTPEQVDMVRSILLPAAKARSGKAVPENPFHLLAGLKLSNEQIARISEIMDEARKPGKDKPSDMMSFRSKVWQRITKEVLTDEQRKQFEEARTEAAHRRMALAILGGVELSDAQMDLVDAIWKKAYNEARSKPADRMDIYAKAQDKIVNDVLTDEQREQLKKSRRGAPHPMPPGA